MPGLFSSLNLASRSLQTHRQGVEVAGHNLANVNNPAYARQRLNLSATAVASPGQMPQGTGVQASAVIQIRNQFLDTQFQAEQGVRGSLESRQRALEQAQASLGDLVGDGTSGGTNLGTALNDLFNGFQAVAANPGNLVERQTLLSKASSLAKQFNQTDAKLAALAAGLDASLKTDVASANGLLSEIARLNQEITRAESISEGSANDLRDTRLQKIEELSKFVKVDVAEAAPGGLGISLNGEVLVAGGAVQASLETYNAGNGQLLVRAQGTPGPLNLTSGSLQGTIDVRDGEVANLRKTINTLASTLITEVNNIHAAGTSLTGATNAQFFSGTNAGNIKVNQALADDPRLVQLAKNGAGGGDNQTALALAGLANKSFAALNNITLSDRFTLQATALAQSLSQTNAQLEDQDRVELLLKNQRSSVSGVSLDEEMTDMVKFQKAFEASAKLMNTIDEMLDTVINLKR